MAFIIMVRGCCLSGGAVENHTKTRLVTGFFSVSDREPMFRP